jgi:hypothetical protein
MIDRCSNHITCHYIYSNVKVKYYWTSTIFTQVELLLGKAYSDFGHVGDAIAVYDQLISTHTDDFRGYLAKVCYAVVISCL